MTSSGSIVEFIHHRHTPVEPVRDVRDDPMVRGGAAAGLRFGPPRTRAPYDPRFGHGRELEASFYHHIFQGVCAQAERSGLKVLYAGNRDWRRPDFLNDLARTSHGVILSGEYGDGLDEAVSACRAPLVCVDLVCERARAPVVTMDNALGMRQAAEYLLGLGHRRIAYVAGHGRAVSYRERRHAFLAELALAGCPMRAAWIGDGLEVTDDFRRWIAGILGGADRPTAFMAVNDIAAVSVIAAAADSGLSVPRDVSVVGFDDTDLAAAATPRLTSVRVPTEAMGALALQHLHFLMHTAARTPAAYDTLQASTPACVMRVPTTFVARESCAPPPGPA